MRNRMHFVLRGTAIGRLEAAYSQRRHFNSLKALLYELGNYCFERRSDGVFSVGVLRLLPLTSHPRTLLYSHLPALLACGAIEVCATSDVFGEPVYQFVGFHEYNLSAEQLHERRKQAQQDWRRDQRRHRAAHEPFTECVDYVKAQPFETTFLVENLAVSEKCQVQPTEPTAHADLSATNHSIDERTQHEVGSAREKQSEAMDNMDSELADVLEKARISIKQHSQVKAIPEDEIEAVERELMEASRASRVNRAPKKALEPKLPPRLARLPKALTRITEATIEKAMQDLKTPLSRQEAKLFWNDMIALGASSQLLEYAVFNTNYQRGKRKIKNPVAYTRQIVVGQLQAGQVMMT